MSILCETLDVTGNRSNIMIVNKFQGLNKKKVFNNLSKKGPRESGAAGGGGRFTLCVCLVPSLMRNENPKK